MHELLRQFKDPVTLTCVGIVVIGALLAIAFMLAATRRAIVALRGLGDSVSDARVGPAAALCQARVRTLPDSRALLDERPDRVLEQWLQRDVLRLARFEAGGWITGGALFFTFFLIALVLTRDVGPAISGAGTSSMASLAHAVQTMGAKFAVSMFGIALTIAHGFCRAQWVRQLHAAAADAAHRFRHSAVSITDYQVECAELQASHAATLVQSSAEGNLQLQHLRDQLAVEHDNGAVRFESLRASIDSLRSIEVSITDIGSELSQTLKNTVKNDVVAGIRHELQDLFDALQGALATNLDAQVATITDELRKIEQAVAGQAHLQLDKLLDKLSDVVSGGFESESSRMREALTQFAQVVPMLESQLRAMSHSTGEALAQRATDSTRASSEVLQRLGHVLDAMEKQQQGTVEASSQMQRFMLETQHALASSVTSANERLATQSRGALEQLTQAMQAATGNAADVYRQMVGDVDAAAATLRRVRVDADEGATALHQSAGVVRDMLQRVTEVVGGLNGMARALDESLRHAQSTVQSGSATVKAGAETVSHHQRFIEDLSSRWPKLMEEHMRLSDHAFGRVASSWKEHADRMGESVSKIGNGLATSVSDFAGAVEDLGDQLDKLRTDGKGPAIAGGRR